MSDAEEISTPAAELALLLNRLGMSCRPDPATQHHEIPWVLVPKWAYDVWACLDHPVDERALETAAASEERAEAMRAIVRMSDWERGANLVVYLRSIGAIP